MLELVRDNPGFATGLQLSAGELDELKSSISSHLEQQVETITPSLVGLIESTPLERYHEISGRLPHAQLLTRTARILPQEAVSRFREMSLFKQIETEFGKFAISDEEGMGRESISLRLVRPGMESDVGSLHADDWFWKLYNFPVPKGLQRVKVWVAICCEPGKSGLLLSPNSHVRDWKFSIFERAGMAKPMLDPDEKPPLTLFSSNPGEAVTFNYRMLHGGAITQGKLTRVSLEFTILVSDDVYFRRANGTAAIHDTLRHGHLPQ